MQQNADRYHDIQNTIVVIKRTAKNIEPIISKVAKVCAESQTNIATPKQLSMAQRSMELIGQQCELLQQQIDQLAGGD